MAYVNFPMRSQREEDKHLKKQAVSSGSGDQSIRTDHSDSQSRGAMPCVLRKYRKRETVISKKSLISSITTVDNFLNFRHLSHNTYVNIKYSRTGAGKLFYKGSESKYPRRSWPYSLQQLLSTATKAQKQP